MVKSVLNLARYDKHMHALSNSHSPLRSAPQLLPLVNFGQIEIYPTAGIASIPRTTSQLVGVWTISAMTKRRTRVEGEKINDRKTKPTTVATGKLRYQLCPNLTTLLPLHNV